MEGMYSYVALVMVTNSVTLDFCVDLKILLLEIVCAVPTYHLVFLDKQMLRSTGWKRQLRPPLLAPCRKRFSSFLPRTAITLFRIPVAAA